MIVRAKPFKSFNDVYVGKVIRYMPEWLAYYGYRAVRIKFNFVSYNMIVPYYNIIFKNEEQETEFLMEFVYNA